MGCGSSQPAQGGDTPRIPNPGAQQPAEPSQRAAEATGSGSTPQKAPEASEFVSPLREPSKTDEVGSSSQSAQTSSGRAPLSTPATSLLSSRQSLVAGSGSLGSKLSRSNILPAGWSPGKGVLVAVDPRTAHINSLACTVIKVPMIFILSYFGGRICVASSKGLQDLKDRLWLSSFCEWVLGKELSQPLVIEDASTDIRCSGSSWVTGEPKIRFVAVCAVSSAEGERIGTMCALDVQPHGNALGTSMMLSNLGTMASRELDGTAAPPADAANEYIVNGALVSYALRQSLDAYGWTTILVDTTTEKWTILYANQAFRSMAGIPPGCLEGHNFWDFFETQQGQGQPGSERALQLSPWKELAADLSKSKAFILKPLLFRPQLPGTTTLRNTQLFRVELRPYDEETALAFEVELPARPALWFAGFQPEARASLDIPNPPINSNPESLPFPGLELGPVIGKGSFGYVCRGALGYLIVAVKIIESDSIFRVDPEGMPLEVTLAKDLRHPNIVQMLDFAIRIRKEKITSRANSSHGSKGPPKSGNSSRSSDDFELKKTLPSINESALGSARSLLGGDSSGGTAEAWLILEYCDLGTLMDGVDRDWFGSKPGGSAGAPNLAAIESTAYEIAAAMRYLHEHNILHGDLTAGNVLLTSSPSTAKDQRGFIAKVADFGLSREALTSKVETNSYGTVTHMPPELLNDGLLSKRADVYAFGVLLVEMYTGQRAFTGMRHPQIIHTIAVLRKHPELPTSAPEHLQKLSEACMRDAYKERPTFKEIMDLLRPHIQAH